MKIAILDDFQNLVPTLPSYALLQQHEVKIFNSGALGMMQLAVRLAPFDVLVLNHGYSKLSGVLLRKLTKLKHIAQIGKVGEHIDLTVASELGISISEHKIDPTASAELTWALILAATRKLPQYANHLRQGIWQTTSIEPNRNTAGRTLHGKTLGIWGYGKAGELIARYGQAFGMHIQVWGGEQSRIRAARDGIYFANSKEEFLQNADVLSLHLRPTDATRHSITSADLAQMKPSALLVNTRSAELIATDDLIQALQQGRPAYAAIDVYDKAPIKKDDPLLLPNVLATPQIADITYEGLELAYRSAFEAVLARVVISD